MATFRNKFWNTGLIISLICFLENCLLVALIAIQLALGDFHDTEPSEKRVYIHLIFLVFFGALGIVCSILLFFGLWKKTSGYILSWILFQVFSVLHFSVLFVQLAFKGTPQAALLMLSYIFLQFYFVNLIVLMYQSIVKTENVSTIAAPWRVPTISELLGDEAVLSEIERPTNDTLRIGAELLDDQAVMFKTEQPVYDTLRIGAKRGSNEKF